MSEKIRLSPSGKVLGDAGPGLQLRLADASYSCTTLAVTAGIAPLVAASVGESLVVALSNPDPSKYYRARLQFDATKIDPTTGSLTKRLQVRYTVAGVAGSWETLAQNITPGILDQEGSFLQAVDSAMTLGSALLTAIPADCELMEVRGALLASAVDTWEVPNGGVGNNNAVYIALTEYYGAPS